jgi:hypothetical protein
MAQCDGLAISPTFGQLNSHAPIDNRACLETITRRRLRPTKREIAMKRKRVEIVDGELFGFGKVEIQRPSNCPQCGAEVVKSIRYGLSMEEDPTPAEERDYVLGGCCIDLDSPSWNCGACGHSW